MRSALRSSVAGLVAALAFACAAVAGVAPDATAQDPRTAVALDACPSDPPPPSLRHGGHAIGAAALPGESAPRAAAGDEAHRRLPARTPAARPRTRATGGGVRPAFARHLTAARDGTISSRSTGLPPPA